MGRESTFFFFLNSPFQSCFFRYNIQNKAMDASCFLTSKIFNKSVDFIPHFNTRISNPFKNRSAKWLHSFPSAPSPSSITTCNLQSRPPENDREPSIKSDWRSFRARLVAGEQASRYIIDSTGDLWVHRLSEPEKGCLLIATEKLDGVHIFEHTIILLISTGPFCTTGIILNRPSLMSIKETNSTVFDIRGTFSDRPLFFGGPLEEGLFMVSSRKDEEDEVGRSGVFEEVMKGLYYGTKESVGCAAEMVKRNVVGVGDFRFFDGYCGWEKDQLKEEIRAGYWNLMACSLSVVEMINAALWEEVLRLVGEKKVW